jgi:hypothetical protein
LRIGAARPLPRIPPRCQCSIRGSRFITWSTIEAGKLADVAVLRDDYLDPAKATDEAIKKLKSVLTVVDGKVVHEDLR